MNNNNNSGNIIMRKYNTDNSYLAQGLSFVGFRYYKNGFGADTIYSFEDSEELREVVGKIIELRNQHNKY